MKMKTGKLIVTLSMAGLMSLSTGSAIAGSDGMTHNVADINKDGMVTSEELASFVQTHFLKMDKNNDHMVDNSEWEEEWWKDGYYE